MDETVGKILSDVKNGITKPIYFLMGEEPFYIDEISDYIEKNTLDEKEKDFNQMILYGRDTNIEDIVANAKRFPIMAEKTVIIVKEAQDLFRTIEKLSSYSENPLSSTILVINYKYKILDKRKKLYKSLLNNGIVFESKKLYENQIVSWICKVLESKNYTIELKAAQMLVEFLGTDLSKIKNELEKLTLILKKGKIISPAHIEENIGISKDFNNFELRKAIGNKDILKANKIINYFSNNPKNNPIVVTISLLNSFFTQLFLYHTLQDKSKKNVANNLGINPYFVNDYAIAIRNYPMPKISEIIHILRETDVKSKGVGANISQSDLLKELLFKIIH